MQTLYKHECRDHSPEHTDFLLHLILHEIQYIQQEIRQMSTAIEQLQAADAAETAELATVAQALTDETTRVNAAITALGASQDPAITAVAADLQTHVTNLQTIATALAAVASDNPPASAV